MNKGDRCEVLIGKPRRWRPGVVERDNTSLFAGGLVHVIIDEDQGIVVALARKDVRALPPEIDPLDDGPEVEDTLP